MVLSALTALWVENKTLTITVLVVAVGMLILVASFKRKRRLDREKSEAERLQAEQAQLYATEQQRLLEAQQRAQWEQQQRAAAEHQRQVEAHQQALWEEQQRAARWQNLCSTFGEATAHRIFAGKIWLGQRHDMLVAALGRPGSTKQRVLKTKTKETWSYWPDGRGHFRLKVTIEGGAVVGWETLEGISAPATEPP
jgi:hypothetical protein